MKAYKIMLVVETSVSQNDVEGVEQYVQGLIDDDEQLSVAQILVKELRDKIKPVPIAEIPPRPLAEGAKSRRRRILQARIKRDENVGSKVLTEFKSERWAQEVLAKPAKPAAEEKAWVIMNNRGQQLGRKTFSTREEAQRTLEKRITSPMARIQFYVKELAVNELTKARIKVPQSAGPAV